MDTALTIEVTEEGPLDLPDYARISIAFQVSDLAMTGPFRHLALHSACRSSKRNPRLGELEPVVPY